MVGRLPRVIFPRRCAGIEGLDVSFCRSVFNDFGDRRLQILWFRQRGPAETFTRSSCDGAIHAGCPGLRYPGLAIHGAGNQPPVNRSSARVWRVREDPLTGLTQMGPPVP